MPRPLLPMAGCRKQAMLVEEVLLRAPLAAIVALRYRSCLPNGRGSLAMSFAPKNSLLCDSVRAALVSAIAFPNESG